VQHYGAPVRYVWKENEGSASARNRGIKEAQGAYVAFLDADDWWQPEKLSKQMKVHEDNPNLKWSYTDVQLVDAGSGTSLHQKGAVRDHPDGIVEGRLLMGNFIVASSVVVQSDVFNEVGRFDESSLHRISEDWDMWLRIAEHHPVRYIDAPLVNMRQHTARKTETMNLEHALSSRKAIIEKAVQRDPDRLSALRDQALANLYVNIGRKWMNREERERARALFFEALRLSPLRADAWFYGVASFLPRVALQGAGQLRRMLRKLRGTHRPEKIASPITD
jgi:glycosyltransferase involved in cell wall biosynthesis